MAATGEAPAHLTARVPPRGRAQACKATDVGVARVLVMPQATPWDEVLWLLPLFQSLWSGWTPGQTKLEAEAGETAPESFEMDDKS